MRFTKVVYIIFFCITSTLFSQEEFKIAMIGDTPYKNSDWKILKSKFKHLNDSNYNLLIHVGDIKRGVLPCFRRRYKRVSKLLNYSTVPYLIIPGDNEYNDCYCRGPKRALKLWRKHTLNTKPDEELNISRSQHLPENFSFIKDSILLMGINNVGGRVHDSTEWTTRTQHNINWIRDEVESNSHSINSIVIFSHASPKKDFGLYQVLQKMSINLNNKIFFIQGDIHSHSFTENWNKTNLTRVVVDNGNELPMFRTLSTFNGVISIK